MKEFSFKSLKISLLITYWIKLDLLTLSISLREYLHFEITYSSMTNRFDMLMMLLHFMYDHLGFFKYMHQYGAHNVLGYRVTTSTCNVLVQRHTFSFSFFSFFCMFYQFLCILHSRSSTQSWGSVLPSIVEMRDQNSRGCPLLFSNRNLGSFCA